MNIFQVSLSRLQTLYSFSRKISIIDSAKRASTQRTIELEKMLEKILLHDHSILVLLSVVPEQIQEFDVSLRPLIFIFTYHKEELTQIPSSFG